AGVASDPEGEAGRDAGRDEQPWKPAETDQLKTLVDTHGANWAEIVTHFPGRSLRGCQEHYAAAMTAAGGGRTVKHGIGSWSTAEDERLKTLVGVFGVRWSQIAEHMPGRVGKQCRERYLNHLDPGLNKSQWTQQEEALLVSLHRKHSNSWAEIARHIPGRSDNDVKNRWNLIARREKSRKAAGGGGDFLTASPDVVAARSGQQQGYNVPP
ncbi:unnamed protein product, partial [Phaeothamnion confervicola]